MIGKNILSIRKKKGMTLSELAERANISKSYLSNIERNINQNPSIKVLERIAGVLDVDLLSLIQTIDYVHTLPEKELIEFASELKKLGVEKEHLSDYKTLVEFIRWKSHGRSKED